MLIGGVVGRNLEFQHQKYEKLGKKSAMGSRRRIQTQLKLRLNALEGGLSLRFRDTLHSYRKLTGKERELDKKGGRGLLFKRSGISPVNMNLL